MADILTELQKKSGRDTDFQILLNNCAFCKWITDKAISVTTESHICD